MPNRTLFISAVVVLLLGFAAYLYLMNIAEKEAAERRAAQQAADAGAGETSAKDADATSDQKNAIAVQLETTRSPKWHMSDKDKKRRAENLKLILAALTSKVGERVKARKVPMDAKEAPPSDQEVLEYVREPVREIRSLLRECYQYALERNPELGGVLAVKFTIVTDNEAGALIESSELVQGEKYIQDAALGECMQETMYALRFSQPKGTGRITVTYPLILATGGPGQMPPKPDPDDLKPKIEVQGW